MHCAAESAASKSLRQTRVCGRQERAGVLGKVAPATKVLYGLSKCPESSKQMCKSPKEPVDDRRIRDSKIWARIFKLVERRNNERFESKHMTAPERLAIRCAKDRDDQCFADTVKRWHASLCVAFAMAQHPRQGAGAEAGEPEAGPVREAFMLAGLHGACETTSRPGLCTRAVE